MDVRTICVFCGAKPGNDPRYVSGAREIGREIARRGWRMVYGGGRVGLMGECADAALAAGAEVVGIIPDGMLAREQGHRGITRLEVVPDMSVRKQRMIQVSDAFVALPGGLGTLDELFEVLTLRQTGYHGKPLALYNQDGYFDPLIAACRAFVEAGFVLERDFACMQSAASPAAALDLLAG